MVSICLKALDGSNYDVRVQVSQLLGVLMAGSQNVNTTSGTKTKKISIEDMFSLMAAGFLKGMNLLLFVIFKRLNSYMNYFEI